MPKLNDKNLNMTDAGIDSPIVECLVWDEARVLASDIDLLDRITLPSLEAVSAHLVLAIANLVVVPR